MWRVRCLHWSHSQRSQWDPDIADGNQHQSYTNGIHIAIRTPLLAHRRLVWNRAWRSIFTWGSTWSSEDRRGTNRRRSRRRKQTIGSTARYSGGGCWVLWREDNGSSQPARQWWAKTIQRVRASLGATAYSAERNQAADYGDPETNYYVDRDPWYTQSQSGRPCPETVWGYRKTMPRSVPAPNAMTEPARSVLAAQGEESTIRGAGHHPVSLDAPDVALRGQRLLAYGERLWWEEAEVINPAPGRARHPARPHRTMARQQWPEAAEREMPAPHAAGGRVDILSVGQPRPLRAEERIYVEPPGAPEIGRRPLDLDAGQPIFAQNERAPAQPMPVRRETPVYEDHYRLL